MSNNRGKVYLVGAGPGDTSYLTVRAQQLLAGAEVLVHDALVDTERMMQLVKPDCIKFDVGKRGGRPSPPQAQIDQLLVEQCQLGKQVVRLKCGDPFIFGRSTSEIQALIAAGCPFEVVPGISSALAAPLLAGIPLTDPVMSRCFAVLTAHNPDALDWEVLAGIETLVILMGGQQLSEIVHQLIRHGRSPHTPIAVIRWAGCPQQQVWTAQLGSIETTVKGYLSPVVIVIGEVVGLRTYLQPTPSSVDITNQASIPLSLTTSPLAPSRTLPLTGKTILVTRSAGQSSEFSTSLQQEGATVIEMPALEIGPPSSWEALDGAIATLCDFDWLILTSTNGVDYFFKRLATLGKDSRALAGIKIAVVGEKTAQRLSERCLQPDFIPPEFVVDSFVQHFPEQVTGKKVLFPRVETGGREVLVKELTAKGAEVIEVAAYQSQCSTVVAPGVLDALQSQAVDAITFASSKTVQCFYQLVGASPATDWLEEVCLASIGPQTTKTCLSLLGRVDVEAQEYTLDGLTQALIQWATSE